MSHFIRRVLRKQNSSGELTERTMLSPEKQPTEPDRFMTPRRNWLSRCKNYSPTKYQVADDGRTMLTGVKSLSTSVLHEQNHLVRTPAEPEMTDLESIIRDFEKGYHSPSKRDGAPAVDRPKSKNFVKKIVAAFEVKYKAYNEHTLLQEAKEEEEATVKEFTCPKRRTRLFTSPGGSNSSSDDSRNTNDSPNTSQESKGRSNVSATIAKYSAADSKMNRRSGVFGSPIKFLDDERSGNSSTKEVDESLLPGPSTRKTEETKSGNGGWPEVFASAFNRRKGSDTSSDIYASPSHSQKSKDSSTDTANSFRSDREARNGGCDPARWSGLDDTITFDSVDLEITIPETSEDTFVDDHSLMKTSTMINEISQAVKDEVARDPPQVRFVDKTPKVVGAFLKKPIEVEDTSIEWIPITGKKLPRKRSIKKLLTSWVSRPFDSGSSSSSSSEKKKSTKGAKETKEMRDSGFDEEQRSGSSSSSASLVSISDALEQQEHDYFVPERKTTLSTFRSRKRHDVAANASHNTCPTPCKQKKLVLAEVPREELKVDLEPFYPLPEDLEPALGDQETTVMEESPDTRSISSTPEPTPGTSSASPTPEQTAATSSVPLTPELPRMSNLPKHPQSMTLPKHPFVALTKYDKTDEEETEADSEPVVVIRNNMYQVAFSRSCIDINHNICGNSSSSSTESVYDVPRPHMAVANPRISEAENRLSPDPIYDVPRAQCLERPRSSIYDDVVALRRRTECRSLSDLFVGPYNFEAPHYAVMNTACECRCHGRG